MELVLLGFVVSTCPYSSGLLHWHRINDRITQRQRKALRVMYKTRAIKPRKTQKENKRQQQQQQKQPTTRGSLTSEGLCYTVSVNSKNIRIAEVEFGTTTGGYCNYVDDWACCTNPAMSHISQCTNLYQKCTHVCTFLLQNGALWVIVSCIVGFVRWGSIMARNECMRPQTTILLSK